MPPAEVRDLLLRRLLPLPDRLGVTPNPRCAWRLICGWCGRGLREPGPGHFESADLYCFHGMKSGNREATGHADSTTFSRASRRNGCGCSGTRVALRSRPYPLIQECVMTTSHLCKGKWTPGPVAECPKHTRLSKKQHSVFRSPDGDGPSSSSGDGASSASGSDSTSS
jgi:hypothetical protein